MTTELFGGLYDHGRAGLDDAGWLQAMLDAEAALARALERAGLAPVGAGAAVTTAARAADFDAAAIGRAAASAGNPVPALVRQLSARVPPEAAGAVHRGATSQDILDTAVMLLAGQVVDRLLADLARAADAAARLAREHASTLMAGRTLLQQAVPVTFGLLAAGWMNALDEARVGLERVRAHRLAVQLGGAAGTLSELGESGPAVVRFFAAELGLAVPLLPWHTDRARLIELASGLTAACAAMGKIARDVTLLAQTEISEVREAAGDPARGGSSAMPHKRNPVAAVAVLGCTRQAPMLLATLAAAAEQELQRAAGAWHSEWEPIAALLRLTRSAASWSAELVGGLDVDAERMEANLAAAHGLPMAEQIATRLAPAMGRLPALDLLREASQAAAASGRDLSEVLLSTPDYASRLAAAGVGPPELAAAAAPEAGLGTAETFVSAALAAHARLPLRMPR